jgi:hypothetical protein
MLWGEMSAGDGNGGDDAGGDDQGETWLTRLSAEEWLRAARSELVRATEALRAKHQRAGVAHARRAAGMAWNAALRTIGDPASRARYGRSYMDHLRVLQHDEVVSATAREAAQALVTAPLEPALVQLGVGDARLAELARVIVDEAARRVQGSDRS